MSGALTPTSGKVMAPFRPRLISLNGLQLPNLSVLENTELMLRAHGRGPKEARVEAFDLIALAKLSEKTYLPYNTLSTGTRARLGFFLATINQPEVLLMDEMLSVADARFQENAQEMIENTMRKADAVVISSHSMATIRKVCGRVVALHNGAVVFDGSTGEGVRQYLELVAPRQKQSPGRKSA
jgi:teichoic acid transport system ATP-binding protein